MIADAVLSMRFHSLVFSTTLGIPTLAIDYTLGLGKTHSLASRMGCPVIRFDEIDSDSLYAGLTSVLNTPATRRPALIYPEVLKGALLSPTQRQPQNIGAVN
jgi:polysaccharide pyruvyl transferase WcaK-like protein